MTTSTEITARNEVLVRLHLAIGQLSRSRRQECAFPLTFTLRSVLFTIAECGDDLPTVSEVAKIERVSTQAISRSVRRLEQLGLVERIEVPADQRRTQLRVTVAGQTVQRQVLRIGDAWFARRLDRLDDAELALVVAALPAIERICAPADDARRSQPYDL